MDFTFKNDPNNWFIDYEFMDELPAVSVTATTFHHTPLGPPPPPPPAPLTIGFSCPSQFINYSSNVCDEMDCSFEDSEGFKKAGSRKRLRFESSSNTYGSKACREKLRRDKLNERFIKLSSILEPGRPPKVDRTALLSDAARMIAQLRREVHDLHQWSEDLRQKIKDLKADKNELRDEKQRLKADKEKLEQQVNSSAAQPGFLSPAAVMGAAFAAKQQVAGNKLMPLIGYPGVSMWQFMQPAIIDTSQDHVLHPPVA